jgi:alpha-L-fucosidase 2
LCLVVHWFVLSGAAAEWQGFTRTPISLDGHAGFVTQPKEAAPGRPWIWRTSFPDYHREVDLALLRRGFHVGYLNVVNLLGCDAALDSMDRFHYRVTKEFGFAERPALYAVSRGGLHAYRYAARRPERIACIYADVPVMSLASWPLGADAAQPLQDALKHYGFADEAALQRFKGNPIDLLEPIAKARLPLRHIISLNDRVVPPEQNTLEAQRRLRALGHDLEIVTIAEGTEKSKGHQFPDTAVEPTVEWIVRHATPIPPTRPRSAPQTGVTPPPAARPSWAFTPDPNLPNVLLLGDSISIGYTLAVRERLAGRANVFRPTLADGTAPENCEGTTAGLVRIDAWLSGRKWEVIHFNWGLHDLKHVQVAGTGLNSANPSDPIQATVAEYSKNLQALVGKLRATGARLVFATTTPVGPAAKNPFRAPDAPRTYNAAALAIMKEHGIRVNDLFAYCAPQLDQLLNRDHVHFNAAGAKALAGEVARVIDEELGQRRARAPAPELNLKLAAPIRIWDEAVPLGNGTMGLLMWGEGSTLRLSLDRGDLWDERPSPQHLAVKDRFTWKAMQEIVAGDRMAEFNQVFDSNYDRNTSPTKLPAGRVEITLAGNAQLEQFELSLAAAEAIARVTGGGEFRAFVDAADIHAPVALVRIPGVPVSEVRMLPAQSVEKLNYPPARPFAAEGLRGFVQEAAEGFAYAVAAGWRRTGEETQFAVTVATNREGQDPRAVAEARLNRALQRGYDAVRPGHAQWWKEFWNRSAVSVPDAAIARHYHLVRYFYGAASRRGAPPIPLQGVWTADAAALPPWKGDYHHNLNTQMTYMAYQAAGHFEEGASFFDLLWNQLPVYRKFARDFYDAPGAALPGVASLAGQALGGWGQYSLSPTNGAWNAHLFYLHWRYTGDDAFLRDSAYPWCREIAVCLQHLLRPRPDGILVLPLSSSPEIFNNSRRAFLTPNSNYDLMCLRMLFLALAEMADALKRSDDSALWRRVSEQLGPWHRNDDGALKLSADTDLTESHRHLSNLMALYPFNLITVAGGEGDRRIIDASLRQWDRLGTGAWAGYSFSWMSALRARVGDAESALRHLEIYTRAFTLRNGFHANGDQTGNGYSRVTNRPFTLEGNFLAVASVHEMLLQSWSPRPGTGEPRMIRVFPATPWRWHDAAFEDLHAEGGHRISARRENNATVWLRLVAGSDGPVRLLDNFGGRTARWNREGVKRIGETLEITLRRGETLEATWPKPVAIPPAPAELKTPAPDPAFAPRARKK